MPHQIFYSWQSDTENRIGRGLIQWALDRAIRTVNADADVDPADRELRADRDTVNVPGMPPLADTIFGKIDRAVAFQTCPECDGTGGSAPTWCTHCGACGWLTASALERRVRGAKARR